MLTKDKRNKLIGSILTLTLATSLTAGCASEEEQAAEEWNNGNNTAQEESSNSSFWSMVTAFGLGYALSNLFNSHSAPPPVKQPPAQTASPTPGKTTQNVQDADQKSSVSKSTSANSVTQSKVAAPSAAKTGIGTGSKRSSAVS